MRHSERIYVNLEAELVSDNAKCVAFIENISEVGMYLKFSSLEHPEDFIPGRLINIKFKLPSGHFLRLNCRNIWSNKNVSASLIKHTGMEIIKPPQEYNNYYYQVITEST
ncbi:MAG: PilZ domain-containing protein [Promethearchaeota archaeon]|jgi:hypothetical protein